MSHYMMDNHYNLYRELYYIHIVQYSQLSYNELYLLSEEKG